MYVMIQQCYCLYNSEFVWYQHRSSTNVQVAKLTADHPMSSLISARMADKFLADLWTASLPLTGPQLSSSPLQGVDPPQSRGHPVDPSHVCQYSLCFCQLLEVHITILQINNHEIIQIGDQLNQYRHYHPFLCSADHLSAPRQLDPQTLLDSMTR